MQHHWTALPAQHRVLPPAPTERLIVKFTLEIGSGIRDGVSAVEDSQEPYNLGLTVSGFINEYCEHCVYCGDMM